MSPDTWSREPTGEDQPKVSNDFQFPAEARGESLDRNVEDSNRVETWPTPSVPDLKADTALSKEKFGYPSWTDPGGFAEPDAGNSFNPFRTSGQIQGQRFPMQKTGTAIPNQPGQQRYPLFQSDVSNPGHASSVWQDGPQNIHEPHLQSIANDLADPTPNIPSAEHDASAFEAVEDWYVPTATQNVPSHEFVSEANENSPPPQSGSLAGFDWPPMSPSNPTPGQPLYEVKQPDDRPDASHRGPDPTFRYFGATESVTNFGFEDVMKQSVSWREILSTGRYFGSASALYLKPAFQSNTAITTMGVSAGESTPFDFDYESAPLIRFGFESEAGPGIELNFWRYDETSNVANFTSTGAVTGTARSWMLGPGAWSSLSAVNAGESITTSHTIDVNSIGATFFKEVKLPISRITGKFGLQWVNVTQTMDATLTDASGILGELNTRSDLRGFGPSFAFEYYRPIGNSRIELVASFGGSLLFGHRDQFVQNTLDGEFNRMGADEFLTMAELLTGFQYMKMVAENRGYFARLGLTYQTWMGGGTAVDPQGNFGLRGFSFTLGYNR